MDKIKFYGTMWCSDCHRSKEFLDSHKIDYEYTDIDENPEFAKACIDFSLGFCSRSIAIE